MKKFKVKSIVVFLFFLFCFSNLVNAQPHKFERRGDKMYEKGEQACHIEEGMNIPDLSDEQKNKIKSLKVECEKKMQPLENELGEKMAKMNTLSSTEKPEKKELDNLVKEIGALHTEMLGIRTFHRQDVRSLLNEEQRLAFDRMGHGRHKGGRGNFCKK